MPEPFNASRIITLRQPGTLTFGPGCTGECVDWLMRHQPRAVLIVHARSVAASVQVIVGRLRERGVAAVLIDEVPPEPDVASFEKLRERIRNERFEAVLAVGGGSVLDVAKLLAALPQTIVSVRKYFGQGLLPSRPLPLVCLPTTAGTGSEVSPNAILYDNVDSLKRAVISPYLVPDAVFVDPILTVSVPPALTAATGIDAMSHCLEAYANHAAHPLVDLYALQGIRLIAAHLKRAVDQPDDLEARSALALGSVYGGLCLGPVNTAAVHALAYPLGSEFRLAHGLSIALLLPHVLRFNLPAAPERYADIALALGLTAGANALATAARGVEHLATLGAECGIPSGLRACGVPADAIPRLAIDAMKVTRLLKNNPREVTLADAERIYRLAL